MPTATLTKPSAETAEKRRGDFGSSLRSIDKATRKATFIASSPAIDSYGESIDQNGWVMDRFMAHPVIPFGHDYWALPVGKATRCEVVDGKLEVDIQFASAEANPVAENVWQCILGGVPLGVSVGFMPMEWHYEQKEGGSQMRVYDKQELLEISVVTIPSNPEALQKAIIDGIRSTKSERRAHAKAALELMTRIVALKATEPEEDDEADEDPEPEETEDVNETEERATLKAYRKLVPALRGLLNADVKENELEQIAELREAIARRDAEPAKAEDAPAEPVTPAAEEPKPAEAEQPKADEPAAEPKPAEEELDAEDLQAIADAVAEQLSAEEKQ